MGLSLNTSAIDMADVLVDTFSEITNYEDPKAGLDFIKQFAIVEGGHVDREQILDFKADKYVGVGISGCSIPLIDFPVFLTQRFIEPGLFGNSIIVCGADFNKKFSPMRNEIATAYDYVIAKTGNQSLSYLLGYVKRNVDQGIARRFFFGDKTVAASGAGTPGLKSAANVEFYDKINGLFPQYNASIAALVTPNVNPASFTTVIELLTEVHTNGSFNLRSNPNIRFGVDKKTFYKLIAELKALNTVSERSIMNGLDTVKFDGKTVFSMEIIESYAADFEVNSIGHAAFQPTKVILFAPSNHVLATANSKDFLALDVYDVKNIWNPVANEIQSGVKTDFGYTMDAFIRSLKDSSLAFGTASWA